MSCAFEEGVSSSSCFAKEAQVLDMNPEYLLMPHDLDAINGKASPKGNTILREVEH